MQGDKALRSIQGHSQHQRIPFKTRFFSMQHSSWFRVIISYSVGFSHGRSVPLAWRDTKMHIAQHLLVESPLDLNSLSSRGGTGIRNTKSSAFILKRWDALKKPCQGTLTACLNTACRLQHWCWAHTVSLQLCSQAAVTVLSYGVTSLHPHPTF